MASDFDVSLLGHVLSFVYRPSIARCCLLLSRSVREYMTKTNPMCCRFVKWKYFCRQLVDGQALNGSSFPFVYRLLLDGRGSESTAPDPLPPNLDQTFPHLYRLEVRSVAHFNDDRLRQLSNLQHLAIEDPECGGITDDGFGHFRRLRILKLDCSAMAARRLSALTHRSVEEKNKKACCKGLGANCKCDPSKFFDEDGKPREFECSHAHSHSHDVEDLVSSGSDSHDHEDSASVAATTNRVEAEFFLTDTCLRYLGRSLEELDLFFGTSFKESGLTHLRRLRRLKLTANDHVTGECFRCFGQSLEELELIDCKTVSFAHLCYVGPSLELLCSRRCAKMGTRSDMAGALPEGVEDGLDVFEVLVPRPEDPPSDEPHMV